MTSRSSFKATLRQMAKTKARNQWQPPQALTPEGMAAAIRLREKRAARIAARKSPDFESARGYF